MTEMLSELYIIAPFIALAILIINIISILIVLSMKRKNQNFPHVVEIPTIIFIVLLLIELFMYNPLIEFFHNKRFFSQFGVRFEYRPRIHRFVKNHETDAVQVC